MSTHTTTAAAHSIAVASSSSATGVATSANTNASTSQQPELALLATTSNHSHTLSTTPKSTQPSHSPAEPARAMPSQITRSLSLSNTPISRHFQPENFPLFLSKSGVDGDSREPSRDIRVNAMPITTLQDDRELALQEIKQIELEIHDAITNGANDLRKRLLSDLARIERDRRLLDLEIKNRIGFLESKKVPTTDLDFLMSALDFSPDLPDGARLTDGDIFVGDMPRGRRTVSSSSAPVSPLLPSSLAGAFASVPPPSSVRSVPGGFFAGSHGGFGFEGIDDLMIGNDAGSSGAPLLSRSRSASGAPDDSLILDLSPTGGNGIRMLSDDVGLPNASGAQNRSPSPPGKHTPRHGVPQTADAHTSPRVPHNQQRRVSMPVSHSSALTNSDASSAASGSASLQQQQQQQQQHESSHPSSTKSSSAAPSPSLPRADSSSGHSTTHANISVHSMATYHGYKYKTLPCKFFRSGYCRNGDHCTYRHDHPRSCKNLFENRLCERGDNCNYSHDLQVAQNNLCYGFNSPDGCGWAACRFLHVSQHDIDNFPSRYAPPPALVAQLQQQQQQGGGGGGGPPGPPPQGGNAPPQQRRGSGGSNYLRHQALNGPPPMGMRGHGHQQHGQQHGPPGSMVAMHHHLQQSMFHHELHHHHQGGGMPPHMMGALPTLVEHEPPQMAYHGHAQEYGQGPMMRMAVPAL